MQIDQPSLVLSRLMYLEPDKFESYFKAYKDFVVGVAKVLRQKASPVKIITDEEIEEIETQFENMLEVETYLAQVKNVTFVLFRYEHEF